MNCWSQCVSSDLFESGMALNMINGELTLFVRLNRAMKLAVDEASLSIG